MWRWQAVVGTPEKAAVGGAACSIWIRVETWETTGDGISLLTYFSLAVCSALSFAVRAHDCGISQDFPMHHGTNEYVLYNFLEM